MKNITPALLLIIGLPLTADADEFNWGFDFYGDLRAGYFTINRDDRNDTINTTDEFRSRIRLGLKKDLGYGWSFASRFAGRYSTKEGNHGFTFDDHTLKTDGLSLGRSTLDESYFLYQSNKQSKNQWSLQFGRFQTKYELPGVAKKSLSRNESPNTDITWTDGISFRSKIFSDWDSNVILQYNPKDNPTTVQRAPLDFEEAPLTAFWHIQNKKKWGPIVYRGFNITHIPDALPTVTAQGNLNNPGKLDNYTAITAAAAAKWPIGEHGMSFMLASEIGLALNPPENSLTKLPANGDSDRTAYQVTFNLINFAPSHSIGLVLGQADAGWLISPDFTPNQQLTELRYKWQIHKKLKLEARFRQRKDVDLQVNKLKKREDQDFYFRLTYKF